MTEPIYDRPGITDDPRGCCAGCAFLVGLACTAALILWIVLR